MAAQVLREVPHEDALADLVEHFPTPRGEALLELALDPSDLDGIETRYLQALEKQERGESVQQPSFRDAVADKINVGSIWNPKDEDAYRRALEGDFDAWRQERGQLLVLSHPAVAVLPVAERGARHGGADPEDDGAQLASAIGRSGGAVERAGGRHSCCSTDDSVESSPLSERIGRTQAPPCSTPVGVRANHRPWAIPAAKQRSYRGTGRCSSRPRTRTSRMLGAGWFGSRAELEKAPEHVHTYYVGDLALWNAAAAGVLADEVVADLEAISRFAMPPGLADEIRERMGRYGVCVLWDGPSAERLRLEVSDEFVRQRILGDAKLVPLLEPVGGDFHIGVRHRGLLKQRLFAIGYPVADLAGLIDGDPLEVALRREVFEPYPYQRDAARAFVDSGGHGVLVLPCGAGKTVIAMAAMAELNTHTLVLVSGRAAASQWRRGRELLAKTTLREDQIAIYAGRKRAVAPVTIATYHSVARRGGNGPTGCVHFDALAAHPWGLVVYDEVHLLPARMFRLTAEMQARRRLGLTATLVREDGRAGEVFALIGPKRFAMPWRDLEASGHIAAATCFELRVPLPDDLKLPYAEATPRARPRIAGENPAKLATLRGLVDRHEGDRILILGTYLEGLEAAAAVADAPLVTGKTPAGQREKRYDEFRSGAIRSLALSKVGNFAIDLPEANVLIQVSGSMGSRQEEAQRLGRVLRPKPGGATFYTLVTKDTVEQEHALHRQRYLAEQGYRYYIEEPGRGPTVH